MPNQWLVNMPSLIMQIPSLGNCYTTDTVPFSVIPSVATEPQSLCFEVCDRQYWNMPILSFKFMPDE